MNQPNNKRTLFYSNICELKNNKRNSRLHSEEQIHEIASTEHLRMNRESGENQDGFIRYNQLSGYSNNIHLRQ